MTATRTWHTLDATIEGTEPTTRLRGEPLSGSHRT
jgi:hypothetical protein